MLERIQSLVEAIRSVSDNIAHDLRTPLTRLNNSLDDLAKSLSSQSGTEIRQARETVEKAISESNSLLATFEAVLRIARLEDNSYNVTLTEVSPSRMIEELVELYDPIVEEKNISLETDLCSPSIYIAGDRDALAQALANLLDNALQHTPGGGKIVLESRLVNGQFEISVTDTGPGIPVEYHDKVIKRFVRLDDGSRTTPGNGLGLCLVDAVARMHKVELVLENVHPSGLKVTLRNFKLVKSST